MRKLLVALITLATVSLSGCIIVSDDGDATLLIRNRSDYVIEEINLAPIDSPSWGPNLLRGDILFPGEDIEIFNIRCDYYDVRIIDETDSVCFIDGVDLCLNDATFTVRNNSCTFTGRETPTAEPGQIEAPKVERGATER